MTQKIKQITGGLSTIEGIKMAGTREGKYGVCLIVNENPNSTAAGVFTSNKVVAAPVTLTKENIKNGKISAIIANSGNANCFTGKEGMENAKSLIKTVSNKLNIPKNDIAIGSTGVIGREMPMDIITPLLEKNCLNLSNSQEASLDVAKSIMTTDTVPKEIAVETTLETGETIKIAGVIKGSGMIAPNVATMLCFLFTDVKASHEELSTILKEIADDTFNMLIIDGDESTNDTVTLLSTNKYGKIDNNFKEALKYVCMELARMMAKDAEGATKYFEVIVEGAKSHEDARAAARSVALSPLVKTAIFGSDPNWGRIVTAVGYSGCDLDTDKITIKLMSNLSDDVAVMVDKGNILGFEGTDVLTRAENIMKNQEVIVYVDLGLGKYNSKAFACDLTYDYVKINAEYTT